METVNLGGGTSHHAAFPQSRNAWEYLRVFELLGPGEDYPPDAPFDDTIYTYGTDLLIALATGILAYQIYFMKPTPRSSSTRGNQLLGNQHEGDNPLRIPSFVLMALYSLSTLAGAFCHFARGHLELDLNSPLFRVAWIITVGCVAVPNGVLGLISNALREQDHHLDVDERRGTKRYEKVQSDNTTDEALGGMRQDSSKDINIRLVVPTVSNKVWYLYAGVLLLCVILGLFRCARLAADIFFLGFFQAAGSAYLLATYLYGCHLPPGSSSKMLTLCFVYGFIANAPLIVLYPMAVVEGVPLPYINLGLHAQLLLAWGAQGLALKQLCRLYMTSERNDKVK